MAHITQSQNSIGTEAGAHVVLSNKDRKAIRDAVETLRKEGTPAHKVTVCECCGSAIRKAVPKSLTAIAKEVGVCRQNFYNYMKADKIELMTFLKIQNVLKCQILQDKEIKEYLSFLTSVLLPNNENVHA